MKIKLTQTAQIPDEGWDPEKAEKGATRPSATNYAGTVLEVGEKVGAQLIADGFAIDTSL